MADNRPAGWHVAKFLSDNELTHEEFARNCGISASAVSNMVRSVYRLSTDKALLVERGGGPPALDLLIADITFFLPADREALEAKLKAKAAAKAAKAGKHKEESP